jgi:hypothetical protein
MITSWVAAILMYVGIVGIAAAADRWYVTRRNHDTTRRTPDQRG